MPWTLYRYILVELVKLLAVATVVLVLVISFAAAIKPLSEGLLGPGALLKYVFYLAPTMLGFTVPFAGAFAGALALNRMAGDNEFVACRASGLGYGAILLPVIFLGLVLMLSLFFLSNWVVPSFYLKAAQMLERDLTHVLVQRVRQQQPVVLGDMVVYADAADDSQPPPRLPDSSVQPSKMIRLRGVAAGRLDPRGRLRSDATAKAADLLLFHVDGESWVTMSLRHVTYYDTMRGDLFRVEQWSIPQVRLPSPLKDNPQFMSWPQLQRLGDRPERYDTVWQKRTELVAAIAGEQVLRGIEASLAAAEPGEPAATLYRPNTEQSYALSCETFERRDGALVLLAGDSAPARVDCYDGETLTRRITAARARLWVDLESADPEPHILLQLEQATMSATSTPVQTLTEHNTLTLPRVRWPDATIEPLRRMRLDPLLELAETEYAGVPAVTSGVSKLHYHMDRLFRAVVAQLHERAAQAVACLLVLMLSGVLSMRLAGAQPLVVYFCTFIPAVIVIIITHTGENMASDPYTARTAGLSVLWAGNLCMAVVIGAVYARLSRP